MSFDYVFTTTIIGLVFGTVRWQKSPSSTVYVPQSTSQMQTSTVWGIISDTQIIYHDRFSITYIQTKHTLKHEHDRTLIKQRIHIKLEIIPLASPKMCVCVVCHSLMHRSRTFSRKRSNCENHFNAIRPVC